MATPEQYRRETDRLLGELSANMVTLTEQLKQTNERLYHVEAQLNSSRGALAAMMFISGGLGYMLDRITDHWK